MKFKIEIDAVTPQSVTLNGQDLARSYVETVLLPLMVAVQGDNHAGTFKVVEAFDAAGLSLEATPEATRRYQAHIYEQKVERERRQAEARFHAELCREPSRQEIAEAKAERERRAFEIREQFARARAARG